MKVEQFTRKSFPVEAVQVTAENMEEVAEWCDGSIQFESPENDESFIKIRVHNPLNDRQTKAYTGDWVLYAGRGYKVYKDSAFRNSFDEKSTDQNVFDDVERDTIVSALGGANPGGTHTV